MHESAQIERFITGVPGLDAVLHGGLLKGGAYLIEGPAGTGKTVLANQVAFDHAGRGGRVVYVTLLAESHARMLRHLGTLGFFDSTRVGRELIYVSGYRALLDSIGALQELIRRVLLDRQATLLVVDGTATVDELSSPALFKQFLHELQVYTDGVACTALLISPRVNEAGAEHSVLDGVLELSQPAVGMTAERYLRVMKLRGSDYLPGRHVFRITGGGIVLYPRIEAVLRSPSAVPGHDSRGVPTGSPALDEMMDGGLPGGSTTLLIGASGTGKTLTGLHFLDAGARQGEGGTLLGFYESPPRLLAAGEHIGLPLGDYVRRGLLDIIWEPPVERLLDRILHDLLDRLARRGARRLFVDGLDALWSTTAEPDRTMGVMTALTNELRARGITTVAAMESRPLFGPGIELPAGGFSAAAENLILLRHMESGSRLHRLITVMKVRDRRHATAVREFEITASGLRVAGTPASAAGVPGGPDRAAKAGRRARP